MLKLNDVALSFPHKKNVLNDVNLALDQKEVVGLVAPNGTGKTTLLNVIMNNLNPDRGYVEIDGLRYDSNRKIKAIHQKICAFPLENELFGELNGYEHLKLYRNMWQSRVELDVLVDDLKMNAYISQKVGTYSLGMKQRLCFAMVVASDTPIMLLDEAMNGLDPENVALISSQIQKLRESGKLVIMVSHLLDNLQSLADRVLFLRAGKIVKNLNMHEHQNNFLKMQSAAQLLSQLNEDAVLDTYQDQTLIDLKKLAGTTQKSLVLELMAHDIPYSIAPLSLTDEFRLTFQQA
ncbi:MULTISPECIES: ABC transporter ATP-binding protein [Lacticaseibacillus]|uniref:ABC transporter ATP-binding protein n=1 Tax=Lacticaseibacillus TaxID=2759736 RepID=UPI00063DCF38|nr:MULTISPECIES: ABC transporter ATP-binding protein [Lacticaseibacillus]KLI77106.1 ABC transporter ATP-binding protein [Lacticaseibacillus casei]